ncbi:NAD(P)/FAD-dependent oxidoreductase [Christiangramia salexigens]|uniref:FAD-dependent oxidoreductase n=1 Tax=Christiangramia salexigens TaxID=1913577 RepID=A0A1L3J7C7_9FLAO|nr:FAD-binding oxidoreductase [Christiangramia salexigens]APG61020.1 FAD-dependent oxidoreductase [Christiangramia salexigens]
MVDYLIVGLGLSGLAVAEELQGRQKSFKVFENESQKSSLVAGGIFNPVILKRFTAAWKAAEQMETALPFYQALESKLDIKLIHYWDIYRRFHSVEEQNDWFVATDKPGLSQFLDPELVKNTNPALKAEHSFGRVRGTGNIDTAKLIFSYREELKTQNLLIEENFDHDELKVQNDHVIYKGLKASNIIFCEGFGLKQNPYFNYLPLQGNKGEYIIIRSEELKLEQAIKSSVFIMPLGENLYKVGATYENKDKSPEATSRAKDKLILELKKVLLSNFEVVDQMAGIRPSVADRKPLVGRHPVHANLYCCNGFGSRGVLIAPNMARDLLAFILDGKPLDPETDISRFTKKHFKEN